MKTYEMIAKAEQDGRTYHNNQAYFYSKEKGLFIKSCFSDIRMSLSGISSFMISDSWEEVVEPKPITRTECFKFVYNCKPNLLKDCPPMFLTCSNKCEECWDTPIQDDEVNPAVLELLKKGRAENA